MPVIDLPGLPGSAVTMSYLDIASDLERRIASGEYPPGSRLPTYVQVAERYGVGVTTAQAALRVLRVKGLTTSQPGVGIFVAAPPPT
jgi:GntR family transcriptional regulator